MKTISFRNKTVFPECMAAGVGGSVKLSTAAALPKTLGSKSPDDIGIDT